MTPEQMLREFHAACSGLGHDAGFEAGPELRQRLLDEEVDELRLAVKAEDRTEIADAIADIVYVAVGTAITYGIPFDAVFAEVHRSNMTKFRDGRVRCDGKIIKGPQFEPPRITELLEGS